MATGINVSKALSFALVGQPFSVSKAVAFVIAKDLTSRVTQVSRQSTIETLDDTVVTQITVGPLIEANALIKVTQVTLDVIHRNPPACLGVSGLSIDNDTLVITGSGTGDYWSEQWRVVRVADGVVMTSGTGSTASFTFSGRYLTQYQLQFGMS